MKHLIVLKKIAFAFFRCTFETRKTDGSKIISNQHLFTLGLLILSFACFFNPKISAQQPGKLGQTHLNFIENKGFLSNCNNLTAEKYH